MQLFAAAAALFALAQLTSAAPAAPAATLSKRQWATGGLGLLFAQQQSVHTDPPKDVTPRQVDADSD